MVDGPGHGPPALRHEHQAARERPFGAVPLLPADPAQPFVLPLVSTRTERRPPDRLLIEVVRPDDVQPEEDRHGYFDADSAAPTAA